MTPSPATARRTFQGARRRRRRNDAAASPLSLRGGSGADASARALAAGLWRLRHAQRIKAAGAGDGPASASQKQAHKLKARNSHLCHGHRRRADHLAAAGTGSHCRHRGILDTIDACVEWPVACCTSSMEKATKWDRVDDDTFLASHSHHRHHRHQSTAAAAASSSSPSPLLVLMEAELEKARGQVGELEEERRVMAKRLERFLRKLAEEKAAWKARVRGKARRAVAALSEELGAERRHRRQLEQANAKLMRELAEARSSAEQQAQSYEAERKARELMEEACSELTREVEEDQAEVELLRRECLRMREDMEEERRMLQMAEVWREERVQMKLSDAKLALESKYTQLNRLQAEMEAFLGSKRAGEPPPAAMPRSYDDHFRRSPAPASSSRSRSDGELQSVSPATDLFLANIDDDDDDMYGNLGEMEYDGARDSSCSWVGTSDRSAEASVANNGNTEARSSWASRRSLGKNNTALIRRLWRSAITESRNKTGAGRANGGGGWSPASDRRSSVTAEALAPPPLPAPVPAAVVAGGSSSLPQRHGHGHGRQSLKEKLMAARMDGQKTLHAVKQKP